MAMESELPGAYEITGGHNPFGTPASNIAGLGYGEETTYMGDPLEGDYDRYLQPAAPFLAGLGESSVEENWPSMLAGAAYMFLRSGKSPMMAAIGLVAGYYAPKLTPVAMAADAVLMHPGARSYAARYLAR